MVVTLNDVYLITDTDFMKALNDFEAFVPEFVFNCHFEFVGIFIISVSMLKILRS